MTDAFRCGRFAPLPPVANTVWGPQDMPSIREYSPYGSYGVRRADMPALRRQFAVAHRLPRSGTSEAVSR
jgi:hypothetical protein